MRIITKMLRQKAVLWPRLPGAGNYGENLYGLPQEIRCRWEDRQEEYLTKDMVKAISRAIVYVEVDFLVGSYLKLGKLVEMLGDLESSNAGADPTTIPDTFETKGWEKLPTLKGTQFLRHAIL